VLLSVLSLSLLSLPLSSSSFLCITSLADRQIGENKKKNTNKRRQGKKGKEERYRTDGRLLSRLCAISTEKGGKENMGVLF